jgi:hypothetical protein
MAQHTARERHGTTAHKVMNGWYSQARSMTPRGGNGIGRLHVGTDVPDSPVGQHRPRGSVLGVESREAELVAGVRSSR